MGGPLDEKLSKRSLRRSKIGMRPVLSSGHRGLRRSFFAVARRRWKELETGARLTESSFNPAPVAKEVPSKTFGWGGGSKNQHISEVCRIPTEPPESSAITRCLEQGSRHCAGPAGCRLHGRCPFIRRTGSQRVV